MITTKALKRISNYIEGCYSQPSIQHLHLSGAGAVESLAEKLCRFYGKKYCLVFSNATTALQAVCLALNLHDTEIIASPINWGGSVAPFLLHGNKLRFISFDPLSLNLDVKDLPLTVTSRTKAVLSVDYNGIPVDSKKIKKFCSDNDLKYISDSSQSFGAFRNNKPAGYFADAIILSFSPGKSVFAFEGGAVITDDETLYEKLIWNSQHPSKQKTVFGISNYNEYTPLNGRMHPISSILLEETFESSLIALKKHQSKCFRLLTELKAINLIEQTPHIPSPEASTFFRLAVQLKGPVSLQKVNDFLIKKKQSFTAITTNNSVMAFDVAFSKQFKGRFYCSKKLYRQKTTAQFKDRITLIPTL